MAAASYHPRILIPKYEQTDNVKPLTANRGLQFAVGWPNLDLKVSNEKIRLLDQSQKLFPERCKKNHLMCQIKLAQKSVIC